MILQYSADESEVVAWIWGFYCSPFLWRFGPLVEGTFCSTRVERRLCFANVVALPVGRRASLKKQIIEIAIGIRIEIGLL